MKILADLHIAPRTVEHLRTLGHDAVRVTDLLPAAADDLEIVATAVAENRIILTQDLDFSALVALSGETKPSVISLRLGSASVEFVNDALTHVLPNIEADLSRGAIATVEDDRIRVRCLPIA